MHDRAGDQRQLHHIVQQQAGRFPRMRRSDLHVDVGMLLLKGDERRRKEIRARRHRDGDADPSARSGVRGAHGFLALLQHVERALRVREEGFAFGRERHAAPLPPHQRRAEFTFERAQPIADRRLSQIEFGRGAAEAAMARDGQERRAVDLRSLVVSRGAYGVTIGFSDRRYGSIRD